MNGRKKKINFEVPTIRNHETIHGYIFQKLTEVTYNGFKKWWKHVDVLLNFHTWQSCWTHLCVKFHDELSAVVTPHPGMEGLSHTCNCHWLLRTTFFLLQDFKESWIPTMSHGLQMTKSCGKKRTYSRTDPRGWVSFLLVVGVIKVLYRSCSAVTQWSLILFLLRPLSLHRTLKYYWFWEPIC